MNPFRRADGRSLSPRPLVDALKVLPGLRQLQVVQQALAPFLVRYEAADVRFARVERIARAPSRKLMTAVCDLA